jgi:hypothetical protein
MIAEAPRSLEKTPEIGGGGATAFVRVAEYVKW